MTPDTTQPTQPNQTMADQLDALDEKITMIMDHLGIAAPEDAGTQDEGSQDTSGDSPRQQMVNDITSSKGA